MSIQSDLLTKLLGYHDVDNPEEQFGKIIGIHAPKRRGKTLSMLMCLHYFLDSFSFLSGIITNLHVTLPKIYDNEILPLKHLKTLTMEGYRGHTLLLDELGHIQDSRMSSSFRNLFVTNIVADVGKMEQLLLYTSQDANQIDRRIRNNVDLILRPSINFKTGMMKVKFIPDYRTYFMIEAMGEWAQYDLEFFFPFRYYYDWYDTKQKIEEYRLTFEPVDYLEAFILWYKDQGYDEQPDIKITNATLALWVETKGIQITKNQLSALMEYMLRKTDLPVYKRKSR